MTMTRSTTCRRTINRCLIPVQAVTPMTTTTQTQRPHADDDFEFNFYCANKCLNIMQCKKYPNCREDTLMYISFRSIMVDILVAVLRQATLLYSRLIILKLSKNVRSVSFSHSQTISHIPQHYTWQIYPLQLTAGNNSHVNFSSLYSIPAPVSTPYFPHPATPIYSLVFEPQANFLARLQELRNISLSCLTPSPSTKPKIPNFFSQIIHSHQCSLFRFFFSIIISSLAC